jgi:hypothetical protein
MKFLEKNVGNTDRVIRFVLAVVFLASGLFMLAAPLSYVAYLLAAIMLFTGAMRTCGAYSVLGISTVEKQAKKQ